MPHLPFRGQTRNMLNPWGFLIDVGFDGFSGGIHLCAGGQIILGLHCIKESGSISLLYNCLAGQICLYLSDLRFDGPGILSLRR